jgi:hypothetical protein
MLRMVGFLILVGFLPVAAPVCVDDAYEIKAKKSGKGAVTHHKKEDTDESHFKLEGPDGKAITDKKDAKTTIEEYKETILEKVEGKRATKIRRDYTRAIIKSGGDEKFLPYDGKTLLIERKDGRYHFTIEGGEELKGKDAEELNRSFNKPGSDDNDGNEMEKAILPKKPVPVNGTWTINPEVFMKVLAKDPEQSFPIDKSKASGQGKLLRAYKKDGRQYGVFDIEVTLPLKGDFPLSKDQNVPIQEGSKILLHARADACIDGTSSDSVSETAMSIELIALLSAPGEQELKMTFNISQKGKYSEKDLSKLNASSALK